MHGIPTIPKGQRAGAGPASTDKYQLGGNQGGVSALPVTISLYLLRKVERAENKAEFKVINSRGWNAPKELILIV